MKYNYRFPPPPGYCALQADEACLVSKIRQLLQKQNARGVLWQQEGELLLAEEGCLRELPGNARLQECKGEPVYLLMEMPAVTGLVAALKIKPVAAFCQPGDVCYWTAAQMTDHIWQCLRVSQSRMEAVMDSVEEAVAVIDGHGKVVSWSRCAEIMYGIAAGEILGRDITQFFSHLVLTEVKDTGRPVFNAYHQSRENVYVLINSVPVTLDGRAIGSVSSERDITETVRLNTQLTLNKERVQELESKLQKGGEKAFEGIWGHSQSLVKAVELTGRVAATDATVLIQGESGTGKELFAKAIHQTSARRNQSFVAVNCSAIPASLFESELFGYEGGAFTGAEKKGKQGMFQQADGGTLFLDEVGELPLDMQPKILRAIQDHTFYRVGGRQPVKVDVRIVAATNRNLEQQVSRGLFRQDLYYRLNVVPLSIPPLRERKEDIPELVYLFMRSYCSKYGRSPMDISPETMALLINHSWPGNVRQLKNVVERMVIFTEGDKIVPSSLPDNIRLEMDSQPQPLNGKLREITGDTERRAIARALQQTGGNRSRAARILGIPRSTLYYRLKVLEIE